MTKNTIQFDLFEDPEVTIKEAENKKLKNQNSNPSTVSKKLSKKDKLENLRVNTEWKIRWKLDEFEITDFVPEEEIPKEGLSLEELRQAMERRIVNFSKSRTVWDFDEEKKILYPDDIAASKGALL